LELDGWEIISYNIIPKGSEIPAGGYYMREFIEKLKGTRFPDKIVENRGIG